MRTHCCFGAFPFHNLHKQMQPPSLFSKRLKEVVFYEANKHFYRDFGGDVMAIRQYEKGDRSPIAPNFRVPEFACRGQGCCDKVYIDETLVEFLQKIREHFGKPVTVNSGYRCQGHNRAVGGANGSRHTTGQAADIAVKDITPAEVAQYAESLGVTGIGLYETAKDGFFVHIDTRPAKSFWYGQAQAPRLSFGGYSFSHFTQELAGALGTEELLSAAPTLGKDWNRQHPAVKPLQKYLASLGYPEVGQADGIAGPKFSAAVAHFQADRGLESTGILEQWGRSWHTLLQVQEGGVI